MLHLLTEENSELKNRKFPLAKGIRKHLQEVLDNYHGDTTVDGYQRLNNILAMDGIAYSEMKRIKNFFDNYEGPKDNPEYILNGGDEMRLWVDNTLNTARQAVYNFKQAKKEAGINNAFRKTHTKDRNKSKLGFQESKTPRTFIISEKQLRMLKEAMDDTFSLDELSHLKHFSEKVRYCTQHLGGPIGKGSARMAFQMDDGHVLKLAYNQKGIAQNSEEFCYGQNIYFSFFPQSYECAKDDSWIVVEAVFPAKRQDFPKVMGISWDNFCKFVSSVYAMTHYRNARYASPSMTAEQVEELEENNYDLAKISEYIRGQNVPVGDLQRISSWGLTNRNGEPEIVLLDSGLTDETYNKFYAPKQKW